MSQPLDQTDYYSAQFSDEDYAGCELDGVTFEDCHFTKCNFSNASFHHCRFNDCLFTNCNLSVISVKASRFMDVAFTDCKLIGVDWTRAAWPNVALSSPLAFRQCILNDSAFFGLHLPELVMSKCRAHEVDLRDGNFQDADFSGTDFTYAQFHTCNLSRANFEEAVNFAIDLNVNNIKGARFSRHEAVSLLESLGIELVD